MAPVQFAALPGSRAGRVATAGAVGLAAVFSSAVAMAIDAQPEAVGGQIDDIVVSATRRPERSFDLPASVDRVDGATIRDGQLGINLSESLATVPGLSVQNRQNYAQDLQLSVRGFGARSSFGVRGVRLYADGIPGTMPDGQGQFSHFDLGSADRIEVLRGPFSALYGNSSGGVVSIYTEDGAPGPGVLATLASGSLGTERGALKASNAWGGSNFVVDAAHFETDGYRDHSHAERNTANLKFRTELGAHSTLTLVGNAIETPQVQDALGLTRAQMTADPSQAGTGALLYDTRKSLQQVQEGAILTSALSDADELTATLYAGRRATTQFQAILQATEARSLLNPGGVIDLGREYQGADVHLSDRHEPGGMPLTVTVGVAYDALQETRRGFLNYVGSTLGVLGALRRYEHNRVNDADEYLQLEWQPAPRWSAIAGLRHSEVDVSSRDLTGAAPPSEIRYSAADPVAGITFHATPALNAYASYGRGFETPTLNDLAYRSVDGSLPGLNVGLLPAHSDNYELGLKAATRGFGADLAVFYIRTHDELAVEANSGGRSVYENIGSTERRGAELAVTAQLPQGFDARLAYTYLRAVTLVAYGSCFGLPCAPDTIAAGSRLPAVPANSLYAGLTWKVPRLGFSATAESIGRSKIYVDDRNSDAAGGYWTTNVRAGFTQLHAGWSLTETARVDNVAGRHYVATVIVNESNGRFFEPDPGRTAYLLVSVGYR